MAADTERVKRLGSKLVQCGSEVASSSSKSELHWVTSGMGNGIARGFGSLGGLGGSDEVDSIAGTWLSCFGSGGGSSGRTGATGEGDGGRSNSDDEGDGEGADGGGDDEDDEDDEDDGGDDEDDEDADDDEEDDDEKGAPGSDTNCPLGPGGSGGPPCCAASRCAASLSSRIFNASLTSRK